MLPRVLAVGQKPAGAIIIIIVLFWGPGEGVDQLISTSNLGNEVLTIESFRSENENEEEYEFLPREVLCFHPRLHVRVICNLRLQTTTSFAFFQLYPSSFNDFSKKKKKNTLDINIGATLDKDELKYRREKKKN